MPDYNQKMCYVEGCMNLGIYPAPKSPNNLNDKIGLCLEHIRLHNLNWNFFQSMDEAEIVDFHKHAIYAERPTVRFGIRGKYNELDLNKKIKEYLGLKQKDPIKHNLNTPEKEALKELNLYYPISKTDIKKAYRKLVKIYHPDRDGSGDASKFIKIQKAYNILMESKCIN